MKKALLITVFAWLVLGIVLPLISIAFYRLMIDGFVASPRLLSFAIGMAVFNCVIVIVPLVLSFSQRFDSPFKMSKLKALLVSFCLLAILCGHAFSFASGPLSYFLHSISSPISSNVVEEVVTTKATYKICPMHAEFTGNVFVYARKLCGISNDALSKLKSGGKMELFGELSSYGISVKNYRIING